MEVQHTGPIQGLSGCPTSAKSRPGRIGPICLEAKQNRRAQCEEIRMLRSTRRGLETWHGRDGVTLADERASQQGTRTSTSKPARQSPTLPMSGVWKRSYG